MVVVSRIRGLIPSALFGLAVLFGSLDLQASLGPCEAQFETQFGAQSLLKTNSPVSRQARLRIAEWLNEDRTKAVSFDHGSRVWIGKSGRSKYSVQLIHGLYNSPKSMADLQVLFQSAKLNVVNMRLPGHFEKNREALDIVHRDQWVAAAESGFRIANDIGDKVILVGHSTGGLLASLIAMKHPDQVAALILFAPAYRVNLLSRVKAAISSRAEFGYVETESGRYISGNAGQQVVLLGKEFWSELARENPQYPISVLKQRLQDIPILMINTALDKTIEPAFNRVLMNVLAEGSSSTLRTQVMLAESDLTAHNLMTAKDNGSGQAESFSKIEEAISTFLQELDSTPAAFPETRN